MKSQEKISKLQTVFLIFLIALAILSSSHVVRYLKNQPILIGEESHYHARIAMQVASGDFSTEDNLIYGERSFWINPYHILLAGTSFLLGIELSSVILPLIMGVASALLFFVILRKLKFTELNAITISCVFMLSPVFISIFSISTPLCAAILLNLIGFYFFINKGKGNYTISLIAFTIASLFSMLNLFMIILFTFSYSVIYKKKAKKFYVVLFILFLVLLFYYTPVYFNSGNLAMNELNLGLVQKFVTDLGGVFGFSIFALLLSVLGFVIAWGKRKQIYYIYLVMLAVLLLSIFYNPAVAYANFVVSIFGGITFGMLIKRKWELKIIRNLSIILLFCGLLFSAVSFNVRLAGNQPNSDLVEALQWIQDNSDGGDVIFSHQNNGFWIQFYASRLVIIDQLSTGSVEMENRIESSEKIFESWDIREAQDFLSAYDVDFIVMTQDLSEGIVWDEPDQGFAYLLRNKETFNKEFSNAYASVWRYND